MQRLRVAELAVTALSLSILPIGGATMLLLLMLAVDVAATILIVRHVPGRPSAVVPVGTEGSLYVLRRTVPELRMHRPTGVLDAQVRWRQAAEAHRRGRGVAVADNQTRG